MKEWALCNYRAHRAAVFGGAGWRTGRSTLHAWANEAAPIEASSGTRDQWSGSAGRLRTDRLQLLSPLRKRLALSEVVASGETLHRTRGTSVITCKGNCERWGHYRLFSMTHSKQIIQAHSSYCDVILQPGLTKPSHHVSRVIATQRKRCQVTFKKSKNPTHAGGRGFINVTLP